MFVIYKFDDVLEMFHEFSHELDWIHDWYHYSLTNAETYPKNLQEFIHLDLPN